MRDRLILLPGWGLGTAPLEPLAAALRELDARLQVQVEPLPRVDSSNPQDWLDELDDSLPDECWLGGWSLGGMLASQLAARRGERCCGLLSLAGNACFVAREDWPAGMPPEVFTAFRDGCAEQPTATLKRFALLCSQGSPDPRGLGRRLCAGAPQALPEPLLCGLDVLAALDGRPALQAFRGPQLHLFAAADALLPVAAARALLGVQPDIEVGVIEAVSHAFVLERPHEVAGAILAFLREAGDD